MHRSSGEGEHFIVIAKRGHNSEKKSECRREERKAAAYRKYSEKYYAHSVHQGVEAVDVIRGRQILFAHLVENAVLQNHRRY